MYQDAKEELQRLEAALLEEEQQTEENDLSQWDMAEALADIPDLPEPKKASRLNLWLTVAIIAMTAGIVAVVIFWLIRYGGAFL